jgi:hypothetical protein
MARGRATRLPCEKAGLKRMVTVADKKIIAVLGATGSQGGGLVRAILSDPNGGFAARSATFAP